MNKLGYLCFIISTALYSQFIIETPGGFSLGGDFTATGTTIVINSSDVVLDLSGRVVTADIDGIVISPGLNNVVVANGEIRNATHNGVTVLQNCSNIRLDSVTIKNTGKAALSIEGSSGNQVRQCRFENLSIVQTATVSDAVACVSIEFADDVQMRNSRLVENGDASNAISLVSLTDANRCIFEKVQFRNNVAQSLTAIDCGSNVQNCIFRMISVLDNIGLVGFTGFLFTGTSCQGILCSDCDVANNRVTGAATGPFYGFHIIETQNVRLKGCEVLSNTNAGTSATSHVFGFYFDQAFRCSTFDCKALYNLVENDGGSNIGAGFFIGTTGGAGTGVKNSAFVNNEAVGNAGFTDQRSFGFLTSSGNNGNELNAYVANKAYVNGVSTPLEETQIISNQGGGSNQGGFPFSSIKSQKIGKLNGISDILSNLRIGG